MAVSSLVLEFGGTETEAIAGLLHGAIQQLGFFMTLIISILTKESTIQVSDRRLSANNQLVDDDSNKAGVLECVDGFFLYGFTGLAKAQDFRTNDWIIDALRCSWCGNKLTWTPLRTAASASEGEKQNPRNSVSSAE